jgi:hypothetical protein
MRTLRILGAVTILALTVQAQQAKAEPQNAGFAKLQSLVGNWEGTALHDGQPMPTTTSSFRLVSDGSVIMSELAAGTPHEMITMFNMDGKNLLATHYCAYHNQPRLQAAPGQDPNVIEFTFKDATNLASPSDPHMTRVKFTLVDPNHHVEEWTATENGKPVTMRFEFHRKQ